MNTLSTLRLFSLADTVLRGQAGNGQAGDASAPVVPVISVDEEADADAPVDSALLRRLALVIIGCGAFYGAAMGTFGLSGARFEQVLYSAMKVPILLGVTFILSLPSFFVLNTLLGLRDDFTQSLRALAAAQAGQSVILASLAPFTLLFYASTTNYRAAVIFNVVMFSIAGLSAQHLLRIYYRPLIRRDARHRKLLIGWLVMFGFLGFQLAWMLRPFVGDPLQLPTFVRTAEWSNAYEEVGHMLAGAFR